MVLVKSVLYLYWSMFVFGAYGEKLTPFSAEWMAKYQNYIMLDNISTFDVDVPPVPKEQVSFYYFSKKNFEEPIELNENNVDEINEDPEKIFVLFHGWLEYRERPWYGDLKNALLERYPNSSVIQVDYSEPAFDFYPNAVSAAKFVGRIVGQFLVMISETQNITPKKIILLGHSLGGHIAGLAGKTIQTLLSSVARIVALDAAGPPWETYSCENRLCETDADVVVGLHTNVGRYGFGPPLGDLDFYPNGGSVQKGCLITEFNNIASPDTMCDHWRSWEFMIEAVQNPNHFVARKCEDWNTFEANPEQCDAETITLGDFESRGKGVYYFATKENCPYAVESIKSKIEL